MNRLRYADVKVPLARVLNMNTTDTRIRPIANEAHRRLVAKGDWVGTIARYRICVTADGCLVWPRQIETIKGWAICDTPGRIHNMWFEFNPNGLGLLDSDDCLQTTLLDRDPVPTFDYPIGTDKKIMVQADVSETAGSQILLRGYDQNAAWIRTQVGGSWIDGEYIDISTTAHYSTKLYTAITEVIKPVTNGPVRLWEYDTTLATVTKALAYYESDETVPIYRASLIPGLGDMEGCGSSNDDETCTNTKITVIAKLRHIDVTSDNDFFLLGNLSAIKLMVMAILAEERHNLEEAFAYEAKAVAELNHELNSYHGDAAWPHVKQEGAATWGAGIQNVIGCATRFYNY